MKARGWRVFATARKAQDIARLRDEIGVESLYRDYAEPQRPSRRALEAYRRNIDLEGSSHREIYRARIARLEQGGTQTFKLGPEAVAAKLALAAESRRPKSRYYVTIPTYAAVLFRRLLPTRAFDAVMVSN